MPGAPSLHTMTMRSLLTAEEIGWKVRVAPERLTELAKAGYAPHIVVDGEIYFRTEELTEWVSRNLVVRCAGRDIPTVTMESGDLPPVVFAKIIVDQPKRQVDAAATAASNGSGGA